MTLLVSLFALLAVQFTYSQTWQDVGGGTNNSSHGMLVWNGNLINLGSFNNPFNRVAGWDGTNWFDLGGGVGIVARAGCVWNGNLVVVGDFWNNFQPCAGCNGVAVWDGTTWSALDQGFNNDVLTCTVYNGDLIIGGDFTAANGVAINRVARWNDVTQTFESMGGVLDMDNDVRCMTVYDGELWVGGDFNNIGGQGPLDGLVKWDDIGNQWVGGNSGVDLIGGVNETVRVLFVHPTDGNLYMGGEFPELWDGDAAAEDFNMSGVAMYDGQNWYPLGTGLDDPSMQVPQAYCRAIYEYNGDLIVGGHFTTADGVPAQKIAKWNGTNFTAMGGGFDGVGIDEYVKSAMTWNGIFFAGGAYTQAEGGPMNYIAQWYEAPTMAPTAAFTSSTSQGCEGTCINFTDNSTNSPTSWSWSFPGADITSSTDQNPTSICYQTAGTYTVTLQACNANGCDNTTMNITIETTPTVTVGDQSICDGQSVTLTATPSAGGGTYAWTPTSETTQSIVVSPSTTTSYSVTYTLNGCTSIPELATVTVNPTYSSSESATACENSVYTYPDGFSETITSNTSHTSNLTSAAGCDSIIVTNVTMNTAYNGSEAVSVCENTTYTYPDGFSETITANTSHTSNLTGANGCDSVIVTNVTMTTAYNSSESVSACENSTYTYPDGFSETITGNTSHTSNLTTIAGCDSIIVTSVTMNPNYNGSESVSACQNSTYTYPDGFSETITSNTSHISNLTDANGCDSVIVTNVTMVTAYNTSENVSACENTTYTYPDGFSETITGNTAHTSALISVEGCDSIVVTNVTMNNSYNTSESVSTCQNTVYTYPDGFSETITGNTSHTSNLTSAQGCDSIVVTNVTMEPNYNTSESANACENTLYTYPDGFSEIITGNTSHTSVLTASTGCDSIVVTNVTMDPNFSGSENVSTCNGSTYTYPDGFSETITGATSHTSNLTATTGCDSVIVTNVTLYPEYNLTENVNVCSGGTYTYPDGTVSSNITVDENQISNLTTINGCDSIIQTFVTVSTTFNVTQNFNICSGEDYTYPDGTVSTNITVNENHVSTLISSIGCDSIITTNLTVNPLYNTNESVSVCNGDTYTYPDGFSETITGATSHTSNLTTSAGCDSIIVTNVSVNPTYSESESVTACDGSTYTYPDGFSETITGNTSHTSNLTSSSGCDSTVLTNVSVAPTYNATETVDVCSGSTYVYPDGTVATNITVNESHTSNLTSSQGCDSTIVTNLNVATTLNYTENVSLCEGDSYTYPDGTVSNNITVNETHISNLVSQNGCDSIITTNISVNPLPTVSVNSATICNGEDVVLNATPSAGGGTYLWSPGNETTPSITVNPGTTTSYSVVYTLNGCASNSSSGTVTVNPMPDVSTTATTSNVITANQNGANYQWLDCDSGNAAILGETSQSYSPVANGNYAVQVDLNGCMDTSACVAITTIGLDEIDFNVLTLYPNPVFDYIQLESNSINNELAFTIYDSRGRLILQGTTEVNQKLDVSDLAPGTYTLEVNEGGLGRYRFVKQ